MSYEERVSKLERQIRRAFADIEDMGKQMDLLIDRMDLGRDEEDCEEEEHVGKLRIVCKVKEGMKYKGKPYYYSGPGKGWKQDPDQAMEYPDDTQGSNKASMTLSILNGTEPRNYAPPQIEEV
jgi:hypothetical protein